MNRKKIKPLFIQSIKKRKEKEQIVKLLLVDDDIIGEASDGQCTNTENLYDSSLQDDSDMRLSIDKNISEQCSDNRSFNFSITHNASRQYVSMEYQKTSQKKIITQSYTSNTDDFSRHSLSVCDFQLETNHALKSYFDYVDE